MRKRVLTKPVPKRMRPDAKYASAGKQEYTIEQGDRGYWRVHRYKGGPLPRSLDQMFTTFRECERELIKFLRTTDRPLRKAIWPERQLTNSTVTS